MENLLNFGFSSTRVGEEVRNGEGTAKGGEGVGVDSDSLPTLFNGNVGGWKNCGN